MWCVVFRPVTQHSNWRPSAAWVWGSTLTRSLPGPARSPAPISPTLDFSWSCWSHTPNSEGCSEGNLARWAYKLKASPQDLASLYLPSLPLHWTPALWTEAQTYTVSRPGVQDKHEEWAVTFQTKQRPQDQKHGPECSLGSESCWKLTQASALSSWGNILLPSPSLLCSLHNRPVK